MLRTRLIAGPTTGFVLSAVFATVLTLVALVETVFEPLRVNPTATAPVTIRLPPTTLRLPDPESGLFRLETVTITVGRGQRVTDPGVASMVRIYERSRRPPRPGVVIGLWALYFLIGGLLVNYLRTFSPSRGALFRTQVGLLGLAALLLTCAKLFLLLTTLSPYVIPVAAMPMWTALYLDRRTAFMVGIALALLTASLVGFRSTAVAVYLAGGLSSVAVFRNRKHSTNILWTGVFAGVAAALVLVAAKMLFERGFDVGEDLSRPQDSALVAAGVGGVLSGITAFALQGVAVLALGAVSRNRLLDLTDLDQPLLKKMAAEAPGSWEHSRAMANLAEAAAASIGADSLLVRVGAYYHDLGKTCQAKYFVENLDPGEVTPHEGLEPDVSADAIMAHVVEGTRILRQGGIPEPVVEFAYTHHGTSVIEYFWHKCLEQGNPKQQKESAFRYPGMRPRTRETAILMLLDSIEAAARTIDPPSREKFAEMVQRIFFVKLRQGQLDEAGLTAVDIRVLTGKIVDTLCNAYHSRIKYPWQDRQERGEADLPLPGVATEKDVAKDRKSSQSLPPTAKRVSSSAPPASQKATPEGQSVRPAPGAAAAKTKSEAVAAPAAKQAPAASDAPKPSDSKE